MGCCCGHRVDAGEIDLAEVHTGDILCIRDSTCAHAPACLAQNLMCMTSNHVGIAIDPADFPEAAKLPQKAKLEAGKKYVFHTLFNGIQIWELERYLRGCERGKCGKGAIWVRQWLDSETAELAPREHMVTVLEDMYADKKDLPYERHYISLLQAYFDCEGCCCCGGLCKSRGDSSELFCSEMVALASQKAGLLGEERPADEFTPMDFLRSDGRSIEKGQVSSGVRFGPPRRLQRGKPAAALLGERAAWATPRGEDGEVPAPKQEEM